jgi:hypothetical protein
MRFVGEIGLKQGLVLDLGEPRDSFHRALVSRQTEIKFAVESGCKPTLMEGTGDGARQTSNYETIYFDTDNLDLRRHQLELYVRNRDGRVTQKIKTRAENAQAYQCQEILLSDLQPKSRACASTASSKRARPDFAFSTQASILHQV